MAQVIVTGTPPPKGLAVSVYGPVTPVPGEMVACAEVGLTGETSSAGVLRQQMQLAIGAVIMVRQKIC